MHTKVLKLLEIEQRDVLISGVVGDIISESLDQIVERHTDRIAIDCAVRDVMDILSDAIRVNFITHDSENFNIDFDSHDLAPPPTQTDSWARGRIPGKVTTRLHFCNFDHFPQLTKSSTQKYDKGVTIARFNQHQRSIQ